ncbi:MAG: hypothetical protein AVDCRST_MAG59-2430 [uncultured Thermomicrobiales bacterium]|uniref:DUF177 domain-containing protein n=1 Tax=uncultured Thermomicrobiales bacterium TaxID=1645740 RepID=A0A6J4UTX1_9BACT|nr:MAG: hypothetical protein AVDCRST_MAG59-2430 [uncultured Thermomicrobiales bacterium]
MTDRGHEQEIRNDTAVNVAGLLKGATGAVRTYRLVLDRFPLDDELVADDVVGDVRLTRLRDGIIAKVAVEGTVELECARCLREYDERFATAFDEEFRQMVDVRTGIDLLPNGDEDDHTAWIDENHELDLGEVLRQEILVALPMRPDCGERCPGPGVLVVGAAEDAPANRAVDDRLAALALLLGDEMDEIGRGSDPRR